MDKNVPVIPIARDGEGTQPTCATCPAFALMPAMKQPNGVVPGECRLKPPGIYFTPTVQPTGVMLPGGVPQMQEGLVMQMRSPVVAPNFFCMEHPHHKENAEYIRAEAIADVMQELLTPILAGYGQAPNKVH